MAVGSEYDVFISYHHASCKDWAEAIRNQWSAHGMKVFLDQEELLPGQQLIVGIARGLACSRFVVVLCTPLITRSVWCTMETGATLLTGKEDRLIPVLLENDEDGIPLLGVLAHLKHVDLADPVRGVQEYQRLILRLGIAVELPLPPLPDFRRKARLQHFRANNRSLLLGVQNDLSRSIEVVAAWVADLNSLAARIERAASDGTQFKGELDARESQLTQVRGEVRKLLEALTSRMDATQDELKQRRAEGDIGIA